MAFHRTALGALLALAACGGAAKSGAASGSAHEDGASCRVLVVMSGANALAVQGATPFNHGQTSSFPTGFFLDEMTIPVYALVQAGCEVTFANPTGVEPVVDPIADNPVWFTDGLNVADPTDLLETAKAMLVLAPTADQIAEWTALRSFAFDSSSPIRTGEPGMFNAPVTLASFLDGSGRADATKLDGYSALFIPGGHAPMADLFQDPSLGEILRYFHAHGDGTYGAAGNKVTSAICHGPIALLSAQTSDGNWIYENYQMTTVPKLEDQAGNVLHGVFPLYDLFFYPDEKLRSAGADVAGQPFASMVVASHELLTGQNQYSAHALRDALLSRLGL